MKNTNYIYPHIFHRLPSPTLPLTLHFPASEMVNVKQYSTIPDSWKYKELPLKTYTFDSPFSFKDPNHFYNVLVKILIDPDMSTHRKQLILEELLQDYSIEHFTHSIENAKNNNSIVYSDIFFKLVHDYQPKLKKLLTVYLNSKEISKKPHHSILIDIGVDSIISILFVSILSNCVKEGGYVCERR
jgi:hypothetical protein